MAPLTPTGAGDGAVHASTERLEKENTPLRSEDTDSDEHSPLDAVARLFAPHDSGSDVAEEDATPRSATRENDVQCDLPEQERNILNINLSGPHIPITIDSRKSLLCLFDTGCVFNVLSAEYLDQKDHDKIRDTTQTLRGVTGAGLSVAGVLDVECTVGPYTRKIPFIIVQDKNLVIMGMESMRKFNIKIDVGGKAIVCGDYRLKYQNDGLMGTSCMINMVGDRESCNIRLCRKEIIPAKGRKVVEGKIFRNVPKMC